MLLEFHEISVQKFFSLLTMVMCEKHCFQTNKKGKKYQMAFVDLVIHKGTTTDSFIIVEEMDSIKKNCRVISRKKNHNISYHQQTKQNKQKNYRKRNFDLTFWFLFKHHIVGILYPPFSRVISPSKRKIQKKNFKKKWDVIFFRGYKAEGAHIGGNPNIIYKMDALLTIVGPVVFLFVLFWEQF